MEKYINPPELVKMLGKRVFLDLCKPNYSDISRYPTVYAYCDNGSYTFAVHIRDESEYNEFMSQYMDGDFVSIEFYGM